MNRHQRRAHSRATVGNIRKLREDAYRSWCAVRRTEGKGTTRGEFAADLARYQAAQSQRTVPISVPVSTRDGFTHELKALDERRLVDADGREYEVRR